jgi:dTDP-D-glucose 4,6-dehydratase
MGTEAGVAVEPDYAQPRPGELRRSVLDPERASIHLGWQSWTELPDGVRAVLDHVQASQR